MLAENLETILKGAKTGDLIPFLKSLNKEGKKEVAGALKTISKEYTEFKQVTTMMGTTFKQKGSPEQLQIIYATAFVVYNRKDYQKLDGGLNILTNQFFNDILVWYCPDWFGSMVNDTAKRDWIPWTLTYDFVMTLTERGYLSPTDELLSRLIPQMIFNLDEKRQRVCHPENLTKRKITCEQHIWLIFSYETTINHLDRFYNGNSSEEGSWLQTIKEYTDSGVINRQRLLKESLLATCRNFTKPLSGWFVELFESMAPTTAELVSLQGELLNVLSSQNSRAVNLSLNMLKEIVEEKDFKVEALLDNIQIVLSSDTKSIVLSALTLLEKVGRKIPSAKPVVARTVCQAFIHNDEGIQQKTAKLILKFYEPSMTFVKDEINQYAGSMLMSAKNALVHMIPAEQPQERLIIDPGPERTQTYEPVQPITTIDELIFLASQAFDNNDPMHLDLLPAALVKLQDKITGADLQKLEPALQRAYNFLMNDWPSTAGYLDHLLATFFIDTTKLLIAKYPKHGESLTSLHQMYKAKDRENGLKSKWYQSRIAGLFNWMVYSKDTIYIIHKSLLLLAYNKIQSGASLSPLSTPTHQHGYVDPLVLVSRLQEYLTANVSPENLDFQVAITRLAPFHHREALLTARKALHGEALRIMEFLLEPEARPVPPFTTNSLWFMAAIAKSPTNVYQEFNSMSYSRLPRSLFTGEVPWITITEHFKTTRYSYQLRKNEEIPAQHNILKVTPNTTLNLWQEPHNTKEGILSKIKTLLTSPKAFARTGSYLTYEYLSLKAQYIGAESNDIQRFLYLFPSNPNPIVTLVIARSLKHGTLSTETDKKLVTKTLESLLNLKFLFSEITDLLISACLVASDKTVKSLAAELWISALNSNQANNSRIGQMIGRHLAVGYAPMKRLTDVVGGNLMKISPAHDRGLQSMIESIIENLPVEAPVGTKRLLELYSELLLLNNSSVTSTVIKEKLSAWSTSTAMKKIIASFL